ncbi:MAG: hypothetical protein ABH830_02250 [Patescibacteria group bacterium]
MGDENKKIKGKLVGRISHLFGQIGVGVIDLTGSLKVGDEIRIKGATTDLEQTVDSMQVDKKPVEKAGKGKSIGLKVSDKVRVGDEVYKL